MVPSDRTRGNGHKLKQFQYIRKLIFAERMTELLALVAFDGGVLILRDAQMQYAATNFR